MRAWGLLHAALRITGAALLAAAFCAPASAEGRPGGPSDEIFYQIFFRSFRDSNGDRIGDLEGLRAGLDYLQGLGVTSILLTPIQPSLFYHNYFADDFQGIDPAYGTMPEFRALVRDVHARGMRIYLDEEFQYLTYANPWFRDSYERPASPYHDFVLYDGPGDTRPEPGFYDLSTIEGYDGRKAGLGMVNLENPAVRAYFARLLVSWLDPHGDGTLRDGVDGFRIDHMMDDLDGKAKLTHLFSRFWRPVFGAVRAADPQARIIAEQADWGYGEDWLTRGDVDLVFAFPLWQAIVSLDKGAIVKAVRETALRTPPGKGQITIIENHDTTRFASAVHGSLAKEEIGAALDLVLRGTPLIYYGQELGMRGIQSHAWKTDANDIGQREAFRWNRDLFAPGSAIWYQGPHPWWTGRFNRSGDGVSVEEESGDPHSLLNFYRRLIALRRTRPEIERGAQTILGAAGPDALCLLRDDGRERTLLAIELGPEPVRLDFPAGEVAADRLDGAWTDLLRGGAAKPEGLTLGGWGIRLLGR